MIARVSLHLSSSLEPNDLISQCYSDSLKLPKRTTSKIVSFCQDSKSVNNNHFYFTQICLADQFYKNLSNVNSWILSFFTVLFFLNMFRYFELFTVDLQFSELCRIHRSVTLSRISSLHQMNARDFVKLKISLKDISYSFIQTEYHVFLPCIITLLLPCFFSKNKKTIIVLKRQNYQPRNTKGFVAIKKLHRFNLIDWVITYKIILTYFLVAYKSEKHEILHSSFLVKQDFDSHEFTKEESMLQESHNILQHQLYAFWKLKTNNLSTFTRFVIFLSGNIQVNPGPISNLCDICGKRVNKRCLCCIKFNVKMHKKMQWNVYCQQRPFNIIGKPTFH